MSSKKFLGKIDYYIIKKYLSTYFLAITLIISISIVFDISENVDDFISKEAPLKAIVFDYYFAFVPYFVNLFSALFNFVAVIYFTSKMAYNSEIIAILAGGISYRRLMRPYMVAAALIAMLSWGLGNFVIPPANNSRINFKNTYIKGEFKNKDKDIHRQLEPGVYAYMTNYNNKVDQGYKFTLEHFVDQKLVSKMTANVIKWDREEKIWKARDYFIRDLSGPIEVVTHGTEIDTTLNMSPGDFGRQKDLEETMDYFEIQKHIDDLKLRGVDNFTVFEIEKYQRTSGPFSTFILTLIGVSLASRKIRGGMGLHLGLGLLLSFTYIMFLQITTVFATKGGMNPIVAVWIPNFIYAVIAVVLYRRGAR